MLRYFFVFAVVLGVALLGRLLYAHQSLPTSQQRTGRIESHLSQILRSQSRWEGKLERLAARLERLQKQQHAAPSHDDRPSVAKKGPTALADDECPGRLPFHTLMTAQSSVYQQWQSRIAYFHWRKNAAAGGRCTDMVGFTRLCATEGGKPDGLELEMPTIFTTQLSEEVIAKHFHFNVLNRPNSILQLLARADLREYLGSSYVLVMETDHVFMRPMPNLASETTPAAWVFGYMHANPSQDRIIQQYWPEGSSRSLDPVGPSPLLIHVDQLRTLAPKWMDFSLGLRATSEAESVMQGWVQEMWGYSIAAASLGIKHRLVHEMQIEASSLTRHVDADFDTKFYIFHYTYGIEYRLSDGEPQGINQIGEWSLDKRHYGNDHPPRLLEEPPTNANAAAFWLLRTCTGVSNPRLARGALLSSPPASSPLLPPPLVSSRLLSSMPASSPQCPLTSPALEPARWKARGTRRAQASPIGLRPSRWAPSAGGARRSRRRRWACRRRRRRLQAADGAGAAMRTDWNSRRAAPSSHRGARASGASSPLQAHVKPGVRPSTLMDQRRVRMVSSSARAACLPTLRMPITTCASTSRLSRPHLLRCGSGTSRVSTASMRARCDGRDSRGDQRRSEGPQSSCSARDSPRGQRSRSWERTRRDDAMGQLVNRSDCLLTVSHMLG